MSRRYRGVEDPDEYERAMREFQEVLDAAPLLHYARTPTDEQVARDNARERKRLGIDPPEPETPPTD